jgi:hypothetical protein
MIFTLPKDTEKFKTAFEKLTEYVGRVELKKLHPKRSLNQNNYLHLILGWFAIENGYNLNEAKQIYKALNDDIYFYTQSHIKVNPEFKQHVSFFCKSSAELTTKEMTDSIEKFRDWSAENGCYLPAPNEQNFLDHIQNEIEKHKEYL